MKSSKIRTLLVLVFFLGMAALAWRLAAGELPRAADYKALAPISSGNLTIFPVVAARTYDTHEFITLDEGLRSGEVVVTERGRVQGLIRPRPGDRRPVVLPRYDGAAVNQLVLVNNSDRPLILLAGEIVTGGKQDRVVGKDRIVPARSDPVDLGVFCVEPGRWTGASLKFDAALGGLIAQPSVRKQAMAARDQQKVWEEVGRSNQELANATPMAAPEVAGTSSYARVMDNKKIQENVDKVAAPIRQSLENVLRDLRAKNAVGVVVAVNGQIVWADLFASTDLLQKYWPKLARSYAAEGITVRYFRDPGRVDIKDAQDFLDRLSGRREVVETEPGIYRHAEITGDNFKVFELTSLLPKTGFDIHLAKMAD
jgi:sulfur carrier protein ThiS